MTKAAQVSISDGDGGSIHAVGIGDLKVLIICEEDEVWYAQGIEIDYIAQGTSLEDVQVAFQEGLAATIEAHLETYGDIAKLLKPAPLEAWGEFYEHLTLDEHMFTRITTHVLSSPTEGHVLYASTEQTEAHKGASPPKKLPFKRIAYLSAAAAC